MAFREPIEAFVTVARAKAADGLTLQELGQLLVAFVDLAVAEARELNLAGGDKKKYVEDAIGYFFDSVAPSIPLPWFLELFRYPITLIARQTVLAIADELIEYVYARLPKPAPSPPG
jgi:hypothetical protein